MSDVAASISFTCPFCGQTTTVDPQYAGQSGPCRRCGQTIMIPGPANPFAAPTARPASSDLGDNAAIRMLLPVGRSLWAIAAGYFGLFSLLFFPAPIAVILGIVAIIDIRRHPNRHGMGRAIFGLVMGVIFSGFLLLGLLGAVFHG